jgi:hypothetical protein
MVMCRRPLSALNVRGCTTCISCLSTCWRLCRTYRRSGDWVSPDGIFVVSFKIRFLIRSLIKKACKLFKIGLHALGSYCKTGYYVFNSFFSISYISCHGLRYSFVSLSESLAKVSPPYCVYVRFFLPIPLPVCDIW